MRVGTSGYSFKWWYRDNCFYNQSAGQSQVCIWYISMAEPIQNRTRVFCITWRTGLEWPVSWHMSSADLCMWCRSLGGTLPSSTLLS